MITTNPRTPHERKQPLFFALRAFLEKEGGHAPFNPWIYASGALKLLIVDRNAPTGLGHLSTCLLLSSTGWLILSTQAIFRATVHLYIYLFILKRRRREEEAGKVKTAIHGFLHLPIFSSTGLTPYPRVFRGYPWMVFIRCINNLGGFRGASTHPRLVLRGGTFGFQVGGFKSE